MRNRSQPLNETTATAGELAYRADGMTCNHCRVAAIYEAVAA